MYRGRTSGARAGYPGADVQNRARNALQEPDVRAIGRISGMAGCPGVGLDVRAPNQRMNSRNSILGRKLMFSGAKLERFHGWKVGKLGEMLDPLETKQIHGSNPTKSQLTNKSQNFGAIFGGEFSELGRKQQNQARKQRVGAPKT